MRRDFLTSLVLGAALSTAPLGASAQQCSTPPGFGVSLAQHVGKGAVRLTEGKVYSNQAGTPLTIPFTYDTTKDNHFELITNPPGGKVTDGPAYLRDADGTLFTGKDIGNKGVNASIHVQNGTCLREVRLVGHPYGPKPLSTVHTSPVTTSPQPAPQPSSSSLIEQQVTINNYNLVFHVTPPTERTVVATTPTPEIIHDTVPVVVAVREAYSPRGFVALGLGTTDYNGKKDIGSGYHSENPLTSDGPRTGLVGQAIIPYVQFNSDGHTVIRAVAQLQRFGASGLNLALRNPAGTLVAREDAEFALMDGSLTVYPFLDGNLGVRVAGEEVSRKLTEVAVQTPAHQAFTSQNPTVYNRHLSLEAVLGPAAFNISGGPAWQDLTEDPLTSGGHGWTVQAQADGRLLPTRLIPIMARVRYSSITGDDVLGPDGHVPFHSSSQTVQAQIAPIALVYGIGHDFKPGSPILDALQIGVSRTHLDYQAGIRQPEDFTTLYALIGLPISMRATHGKTDENPRRTTHP